LQTAIIVTDSIETRNKIAVLLRILLFTKNSSGARTKATRYQHFAARNFDEISPSVEKRTVTTIQAKLQNKRITKGCFVFEEISEGLKKQYAIDKTVMIHMSGSSGRSVESEELKLYSIDHGKAKMSK